MKRQVLVIALTGLLLGVVTALIVWQITPRYTATSLVLVDASAQRLVDHNGTTQSSPGVDGVMGSHVEVLRSDAVFLRALDDQGLTDTLAHEHSNRLVDRLKRSIGLGSHEAHSTELQNAMAIAHLRDHTQITRRERTFVISVAVEDTSRERAMQLADGLVSAYLANQIDAKRAAAQRAELALSGQVMAIAMDLRRLENALDTVLLEAANDIVLRQRLDDVARPPDVIGTLQAVAQERQELFDARATLLGSLRDEDMNRLIGDQAYQLDLVNNSNALSEEASLHQQRRDAEHQAIDERLDALDRIAFDARQELRDILNSGELSEALVFDLSALQQEAETTRALYGSALERLKQAEANTRIQVADARLMSPASLPIEPSYPSVTSSAFLMALVGLGLGAGLGLVRESQLGGVTNTPDLERHLGLSVSASVPSLSPSDSVHRHIFEHPQSRYNEEVRRLSLSLDAIHMRQSAHGMAATPSIMFTSANAHEGASDLALSYAMQMAMAGKKTLLIDADFRQPHLAALLGNSLPAQAPQLSDMIAGNTAFHQIATIGFRDPLSGLNVIGNQHPTAMASASLVASDAFANLMAAARIAYDVVVVEGPPLLPVVDGRILLRHVNAVCLAIRSGHTTMKHVSLALRELDQPGAPEIISALTHTID